METCLPPSGWRRVFSVSLPATSMPSLARCHLPLTASPLHSSALVCALHRRLTVRLPRRYKGRGAAPEGHSQFRGVMLRESALLTYSGHIAPTVVRRPWNTDERSPRIWVCPTKKILRFRVEV